MDLILVSGMCQNLVFIIYPRYISLKSIPLAMQSIMLLIIYGRIFIPIGCIFVYSFYFLCWYKKKNGLKIHICCFSLLFQLNTFIAKYKVATKEEWGTFITIISQFFLTWKNSELLPGLEFLQRPVLTSYWSNS